MMSFQIDPLVSDLLVYSALRHDSSGHAGSVRNGFYRLLLWLGSMRITPTATPPLLLYLFSDTPFLDFDFLEDPVFITSGKGEETNEESELSEVQQNEIREYFQDHRKTTFKNYGILVSSAADQKRSLLTQNGPSFGLIKKLQVLAKASYSKVWIQL